MADRSVGVSLPVTVFTPSAGIPAQPVRDRTASGIAKHHSRKVISVPWFGVLRDRRQKHGRGGTDDHVNSFGGEGHIRMWQNGECEGGALRRGGGAATAK